MLVKVINTVLEETYTTDELTERVGYMRDHYHKQAFTPSEADVDVQKRFSGIADQYTLAILEKWEKEFSKLKLPARELYQTLETIEEEVSTIPSATLYLPIRFSPEYIAGFGKWFREHTEPNILLTVRTDSRLAGGCGVVWNDVYHDLSLRYFVHDSKRELVQMINKTIDVR
jgi:hypothetical protein